MVEVGEAGLLFTSRMLRGLTLPGSLPLEALDPMADRTDRTAVSLPRNKPSHKGARDSGITGEPIWHPKKS